MGTTETPSGQVGEPTGARPWQGCQLRHGAGGCGCGRHRRRAHSGSQPRGSTPAGEQRQRWAGGRAGGRGVAGRGDACGSLGNPLGAGGPAEGGGAEAAGVGLGGSRGLGGAAGEAAGGSGAAARRGGAAVGAPVANHAIQHASQRDPQAPNPCLSPPARNLRHVHLPITECLQNEQTSVCTAATSSRRPPRRSSSPPRTRR